MLPLYLLLLPPLSSHVAGAVDKTFGVPPDLVSKYVPTNGKWRCLDGSREIPWEFVNDDSCDCGDGSDEPGTGACPDTFFYCHNKGHIGASIPSSRVRDGLCEPQCCDGSDELPGVCKDVCKEVGEEYRKKHEAEMKLRKTGSKIRSTYIAFAHKEKKRLEERVESLEKEIQAKEKEVERLRDIAEHTESLSAAALEYKKQSPFYQTLIEHHNALKSLQHEHEKHLENEKKLGEVLDSLRRGYNPNYQDMAVLEAVRGWEEHAGLPHINEVNKEDSAVSEETQETEEKMEAPLEEGMWDADKLKSQLDGLLNTDYTSLLLEHDEYTRGAGDDEEGAIYDVASYLPEFALEYYDQFKDGVVSLLETLRVIPAADKTSVDSSRARQAFTDAENNFKKLQKEKKETEDDILKIFDVEGFGAEGEWKKLDGNCLEYDNGEYIYETCLFKEAKQKPKNGGMTYSLGRFESWNPSPDVKPGSPEYYSKQVYKHGARCWNGPERNVILVMACGTENAITSVQELEKCEYQFTGTSPALCLPFFSNTKKYLIIYFQAFSPLPDALELVDYWVSTFNGFLSRAGDSAEASEIQNLRSTRDPTLSLLLTFAITMRSEALEKKKRRLQAGFDQVEAGAKGIKTVQAGVL
ncbi:Glucosidase 2 subunit beta [Leucoagaricus sp. SymC.cos]|nr:Glucosidase 2 subunit beta [Leucoagaricus sp. SymC.cos]